MKNNNAIQFADKINVIKSFYLTFDGRRRYCKIPNLVLNDCAAALRVHYGTNDEENYSLVSKDGTCYTGSYLGTDDDSRVEFRKFVGPNAVILAGTWKCGGREGQWYIEGVKLKDGNKA